VLDQGLKSSGMMDKQAEELSPESASGPYPRIMRKQNKPSPAEGEFLCTVRICCRTLADRPRERSVRTSKGIPPHDVIASLASVRFNAARICQRHFMKAIIPLTTALKNGHEESLN
jgi:hypothetical protein